MTYEINAQAFRATGVQHPLASSANELDEILGKFLLKFRRVGLSNIGSFANSFCQRFGLHDATRDPRVFLPHLGVQMRGELLPRGVRAVWLRAGDEYHIHYARHLAGRLGLVLWHEFCEILISHPRFPSRLAPEAQERLATLFAVHVMMPEDEVRKQAMELRHPAEQDKSRVLAIRFAVSLQSMRLRLRELGLEYTPNTVRRRY